MRLTVRQLPLLAALGFAVSMSLILLSRTSMLEAGLVLPVFVLFLLLVLYALAYHLRKPVLSALDSEGQGAAPKLPHLLARMQPRRFALAGSQMSYEPPYLVFEPPVVTFAGERLERLYLNPKHVSGGTARIEAFLRHADTVAERAKQRSQS